MKKIFMEDLIKWENNARYNGKVNWKKCVGRNVRFIYDEIEDDLKIIGYSFPRVKLFYMGKEHTIKTSQFLQCSLGAVIGKVNREYLFSVNEQLHTKTGEIKILEQIRIKKGKDIIRGYKYKCLIDGHEDETTEYHLKTGRGCSVCGNHKVIKGINDISTTHPHLIKYFINEEDAYKISHGSEKKLLMKCKDCGYQRVRVIKDLVRKGFACNKCSDGFSYPEKFMFLVLEQLPIEFETQYCPQWSGQKRYDFFIHKYNMIIETHGIQHYNNSFKMLNGRSLKEEENNDETKKIIALNNDVKNYIIIDCRESQLDWVKNSIVNSKLSLFFDLSKIDWLACHEFASNTRVKEVCELWNNGLKDMTILSEKMNLSDTTLRRYLQTGRELGLNNYDPYINTIKGGLSRRKKIICLNTREVFESTKEIKEKYNIHRSSVTNMCNNLNKVSYISVNNEPYVFMFYSDFTDINNENEIENLLNRALITYNKRPSKEIVCITTNKIYRNLSEASKDTNILYQGISACCKGKQRLAGGYKWMYKEDYDKYIEEKNKENIS